ncbi:ATP-binding protein [Slackia exigua]
MAQHDAQSNIGLKTKIIGLLGAVLLALVLVDIAWTYHTQKQATEGVMLQESRILVTEMNAIWKFVSINQDAINHSADGSYDYKGLHCALAGEEVATFFSDDSDYSIRFTRLSPRNLKNSPDAYEKEALDYFADNASSDEYYGFSDQGGQSAFRYISVMRVSENCTECHGGPVGEIDPTGFPKEGWEVGDMAGVVSVTVPTDWYFSNMYDAIIRGVLFFLATMACMAGIVYFALTRLVTNPLSNLRRTFVKMSSKSSGSGLDTAVERVRSVYSSTEIDDLLAQFELMAESLSSMYSNLESQVEDRTMRLSIANEELERQRLHVERVNDRLKRENRFKSDFLAIVSHELRTPLTSILAFADLMEESVPPSNELARTQLGEIGKNGRILLEMVDNVLETARIQVGSEKLNLEWIDLGDVVGMVEASSRPLAEKKSIEFTVAIDADVPVIRGDWEKIRRILVNLVSNAIKFTERGGTVHVGVSYDGPSESVSLEVVDDGIGIPEDKWDLVFERFSQENMSTVRRYGGSGLGLSLVKELSRMLGGSVSLISTPGLGSTFTVRLPIKQEGDVHDEDHAYR